MDMWPRMEEGRQREGWGMNGNTERWVGERGREAGRKGGEEAREGGREGRGERRSKKRRWEGGG